MKNRRQNLMKLLRSRCQRPFAASSSRHFGFQQEDGTLPLGKQQVFRGHTAKNGIRHNDLSIYEKVR
jgi:hypothetical protein